MIYRAIVLNNSNFFTDGYVWVRIDNDVNGVNSDLHKDPKYSITEQVKSVWDENAVDYEQGGCSKAFVCSPFGGGEGYGMFCIPQVNSRVIVSNIDNDIYSYVILGSVFDNKAGNIPLPGDNGINNPNITENSRKITDMNGSLVISMKHTELKDPLNTDDETKKMLDWKQRPVENLLVFNRNGSIIQHNILDSDTSKGNLLFEMDADGASIDYQMGDDFLGRMMVAIDPNDKKPIIELSSMQGQNITQIKGQGKQIDLLVSDGSQSSNVSIKQNEVVISTQQGSIAISSGNISVVAGDGSKVVIKGDKVALGDGTNPVVTTSALEGTVPQSIDDLKVSTKVYA